MPPPSSPPALVPTTPHPEGLVRTGPPATTDPPRWWRRVVDRFAGAVADGEARCWGTEPPAGR